MTFWSKALGNPAPTDPTPPAPAPAQTWWAPPPAPLAPPGPAQHAPPAPSAPSAPSAPAAPSKAASARITSACPECASENYYSPQGTNSMAKCFECGYNARFHQSGGGGGLPSGEGGPATPAKQVSTANNFNPQQIIGHVG